MAKITKAKDKTTSKKPAASTKKAPTKKSASASKKAPGVKSKSKAPATASKKTVKAAAAPKKAVKTAKPAKAAKTAKAAKAPAVKAAPKAVPKAKAAPVKEIKAKEIKTAAKAEKAKAVAKAPVEKIKEAAAAPVAPPPAPKKPEKLDFAAGDFVVYPAHGVGQVEGVETTIIAGMEVTLYTICFEKDRMRLKLPVTKVKSSGLRKLSSKDRLKDALGTLQGRSQVRRIMWSRRAQEYEAKINSGDPVSIAEVLRDLRKADESSEQSYSERQIYQAALERLAREVAAIEKIDEKKAAEKLEAVLSNVA